MLSLSQTPALLKHSTRALSVPETTNKRRSILPSMTWKPNPEIEIVLDGENHFIHSYSTFDEISGHVDIRFDRDTCIDDFSITFQGSTATWVDKIATSSPSMGKSTGRHTFLRVQQPIDQTCLPEFSQAKAGVTYTVPFKFVVPDRVLDFTCNHKVEREDIRLQHLQLPPSIGDPMLSGHGNVLMDDLAPDMSRISYSIRAALVKASPSSRKPELLQQSKGIRIVPARDELPPLTPDCRPIDGSTKYVLRKEKTVRRGIFKLGKKQGRLSAESSQPSSLKLPHPSMHDQNPITTTTNVQLRYDPASVDEQPPPLNSIASKLKAWTFFGAAPWTYVPAPDSYDTWSTLHSQYPISVDLSTLSLANVEWVKHQPGASASASISRSNSVSTRSCAEGRQKRSVTTSMERSYSHESHDSCSSENDSASTHSHSASSDSDSTSTSFASSPLNHDTSICSPSTTYDASLPYYTASVTCPITLPVSSPSNSFSRTGPSTTLRSNSTSGPAPDRHFSGSNAADDAPATKKSISKSSGSCKSTTFLPTFHSCLVSRVYSVELTASFHSAPNITLKLPIQLSLPCTSTRPQPHGPNYPPPAHPLAHPDPPTTTTPQFSNPFPSNPADDIANDDDDDELLARAVDARLSLPTRSNRRYTHDDPHTSDLSNIPEYEDTYQVIGREGGGGGHTPAADLPPDYASLGLMRPPTRTRTAPAPHAINAYRRSGSGSGSTGTGTGTGSSTTGWRRFSLI